MRRAVARWSARLGRALGAFAAAWASDARAPDAPADGPWHSDGESPPADWLRYVRERSQAPDGSRVYGGAVAPGSALPGPAVPGPAGSEPGRARGAARWVSRARARGAALAASLSPGGVATLARVARTAAFQAALWAPATARPGASTRSPAAPAQPELGGLDVGASRRAAPRALAAAAPAVAAAGERAARAALALLWRSPGAGAAQRGRDAAPPPEPRPSPPPLRAPSPPLRAPNDDVESPPEAHRARPHPAPTPSSTPPRATLVARAPSAPAIEAPREPPRPRQAHATPTRSPEPTRARPEPRARESADPGASPPPSPRPMANARLRWRPSPEAAPLAPSAASMRRFVPASAGPRAGEPARDTSRDTSRARSARVAPQATHTPAASDGPRSRAGEALTAPPPGAAAADDTRRPEAPASRFAELPSGEGGVPPGGACVAPWPELPPARRLGDELPSPLERRESLLREQSEV